jgi:hypothetical protein
VPTTLNTDDPGYLGIDLTGELVTATAGFGWTAGHRRRLLPSGHRPPVHVLLDGFEATDRKVDG